MDSRERSAIEWECAHNTVKFYRRLDEARGEEAATLFAEDGIWYREGDDGGYTGRAEIAGHVNRVRQRGDQSIPQDERVIIHQVINVEVTVMDENTAEVRAHTVIIHGRRGKSPAEPGEMRGVTAVYPTVEIHKRTPEGWRIASKRTSRLLKVPDQAGARQPQPA